MISSSIPYKFGEIFGKNAGGAYLTTPIPQTTGSGIRASQDLGFPPATATPVGSGGTPPDIRDFNGIFQYVTAWLMWVQAGGAPVAYDATFQTAIGGYPTGAVVGSAVTAGKTWISTADNNLTNPDAAGSGWLSASTGRLIRSTPFVASGTYTPDPLMGFVEIECQGGGGAGAGATLPSAGNVSLGAPGTAGAYALGRFSAASIGGTIGVTIGAAGTSSSGGAGSNGGASSVGSLISAPGGIGGGMFNNQVPPVLNGNGTQTSASTGGNIYFQRGGAEGFSMAMGAAASAMIAGAGGSSLFGAGSPGVAGNGTASTATNYGSGGGGSAITNGFGGNQRGADAAGGIVIIHEYSV